MIPRANRVVWLFGLGYFLFYTPYSAWIKLTMRSSARSGFALLPSAVVGTVVVLPLIITLLGWWKHLTRPTLPMLVAGIGTGVIIATTTITFTFRGISIVLALLLMRGGILIMAPVVDRVFGRNVRWFSWAAFFCSAGALGVALAQTRDYQLTLVAALNTAAYLVGYAVRVPAMTHGAKTDSSRITRQWFVTEGVVALVVLAAAPALVALTPTAIGRDLLFGFGALGPDGFVIGALYAGLYLFGTLIYLDRRENTFCVPLFCGASLLAGFSASYLVGQPPPTSQLAAASLIVAALLFLSPAHHIPETFVARAMAALRRNEVAR